MLAGRRKARRRAAFATKQAGEKTATTWGALAGFQLLDPLVEASKGSMLKQQRLGHVVGGIGLLGQMLADQLIRLLVSLAIPGLRLLEAVEQSIDQTLFL